MPPRRTTPKGYERARVLRRQPTPAEAKLWAFLRHGRLRGVDFRRQHAIGPYVVDFCAPKHKLVVEVDGSQHLGQQQHDVARAVDLESRGYRVLRIWNNQVLNDMEGVGRYILDALKLI